MPRSAEIIPLGESGRLRARKGLLGHTSTGGEFDYFAYLPERCTSDSPMLVSVHGIERLALQHAVRFSRLAEQYGFIVLAPLFSKERAPHYQRVERSPAGECPMSSFELTLAHFEREIGLSPRPLHLFGYSGGAQFAMRYALLGKMPVSRLVLAAPGWFTMPDPAQTFPYGLGSDLALSERAPDLMRLLSIPVLVTVGTEDIRRDKSLNRSARVEAQQGKTRLARAKRWYGAMSEAAAIRGLPARTELRLLDGAGHDFDDNMQKHGLGEFVVDWLINRGE